MQYCFLTTFLFLFINPFSRALDQHFGFLGCQCLAHLNAHVCSYFAWARLRNVWFNGTAFLCVVPLDHARCLAQQQASRCATEF